jgi:amino acid adenylation domain-containing protein
MDIADPTPAYESQVTESGYIMYPASEVQNLFWGLQKADEGRNPYNLSIAFRIQGRLDLNALSKALDTISALHPALRTIFFEKEGHLFQRVLPEYSIPLLHIPHEEWQVRYKGSSGEDILKSLLKQTLDLEKEPPVRVHVISPDREYHLLQFVIHHIISDNVSKSILLRQVSEIYNSISEGNKPRVQVPALTLGILAKEEQDWLVSQEAQDAENFLIGQLRNGGLGHPWPIPSLAPPSKKRSQTEIKSFQFDWDADSSGRIRAFTKTAETSLFRFMLGAYFLTLQRLMPGNPVTVGATVDTRRTKEERGVIGCLINTVPISMVSEGTELIGNFLERCDRLIAEAIGLARVPYLHMYESWRRGSQGQVTARWKTLFNFRAYNGNELKLTDTRSEYFLNQDEGWAADLTFILERRGQETQDQPISLDVHYDAGILSRQQVDAILECWKSVLIHCVNSHQTSVNEILLPGIGGRYSEWQRDLNTGNTRKRLESYWRERLSNMSEPVLLTPDHKSSGAWTGCISEVCLDLDEGIPELLDVYCQNEGLSRLSVWISAWQILQARLGKGEEVVLATPVSVIDNSEWHHDPGIFLNTIPIRTRVDENLSFRSFCVSGHRSLVQDISHGQLPYEDIIRVSGLDLGSENKGLPQVMFQHQREFERIMTNADVKDSNPKFRYNGIPLSVHLTEERGSVTALLSYDTGIYSSQRAESILKRFQSVVTQVLANPDICIADIDILLPGELKLIMDLSGRRNEVSFADTTLHAIFRNTALRYPGRTAVIEADGRETSYSDLFNKMRHVAAYLRRLDLTKESVIAVQMQRSASLMASMLGILESGYSFLLLEPSLPMDRLRTISEQARVQVLISEEGMPVVSGFSNRTHLYGDIMQWVILEDDDPQGFTEPSSLACVIFTSGSTGVPKGVMLEHRNLVNYLFFLRDFYSLTQDVRSLQKTLFSFDVCLYELLLPMTTGGSIVMAETGREMDMQRLVDVVIRNRVTYLFFTPAQLQLFIEVPEIGKINGILEIILSAGEALDGITMQQCLSIIDVDLSNAYGPAEAGAVTQWMCYNSNEYTKPPIGIPNPNVDILIMDKLGRHVPPGMPGEIWIGGAQTGRGYINNEEETIKRFVDDPIEPGSGRRYYRTGDLAYFLQDGNIRFLGRMDDQLKILGVRIELGDVTSALKRCEGVREAVVLSESDGKGSNRLRAWVTLKEGFVGDESRISSSLLELLPGYMVPFRIHVMDSIPLTSHGKTDHLALKAYAESEWNAFDGLPLSTTTEQKLAKIWSDLLGIKVLFRNADFFQLGGHSLMAMRLSGRIIKDYNISISLADLYTDGRLDRLAGRVDKALLEKAESHRSGDFEYKPEVVWKGKGSLSVYSFFFGPNNIKKMAEYCQWEWSVMEFTDPQILKGEVPDQPVESLAPVYADAILKVHEQGPILLMGSCIRGIDAYATACRLQQMTPHPIHVLLFDTRYPQAPLESAALGDKFNKLKQSLSGIFVASMTEAIRKLAEMAIRGSVTANRAIRLFVREAVAYRLFDPEWYLMNYPDVDESGVDPILHYFTMGWREFRDPSLIFNRSLYRHFYQGYDIEQQNPVLHYLLTGRLHTSVRTAVRELYTSEDDLGRIMESGWFDTYAYTRAYPSIPNYGRAPLSHYMAIGWRYARKPYSDYDPEWFSLNFPGFVPGSDNPLRHLLRMPEIPVRPGKDPERNAGEAFFQAPITPTAVTSIPKREKANHDKAQKIPFSKADWDILKVRSVIRSRYKPESFKGNLYLFVNQFLHTRNPSLGWQDGPHGSIKSIRMHGDHYSYLIEDFKENASKLNETMNRIFVKGMSEG